MPTAPPVPLSGAAGSQRAQDEQVPNISRGVVNVSEAVLLRDRAAPPLDRGAFDLLGPSQRVAYRVGRRTIFLINLPVGVAAVWLVARAMPESADREHAALDPPGQLLGLLCLAALTYGLIESRDNGWGWPRRFRAAHRGVTRAWPAGASVPPQDDDVVGDGRGLPVRAGRDPIGPFAGLRLPPGSDVQAGEGLLR
jgi:hypothetical protein